METFFVSVVVHDITVPTLLGALIEWKRILKALLVPLTATAVPTLLGALIEWKRPLA